MSIRNMIAEIRQLVRDACESEDNPYGHGIWSHHIKPVVGYAEQLAPVLGADPEVVEIAALLHDIAAIRDERDRHHHHTVGARQAETILTPYGYPGEKICLVKRCILTHRASTQLRSTTVEQTCLSSADAMAHISAVPSLLYMTYVHMDLSIDEGRRWTRNKLKRSWNKLCPEAEDLVRTRYAAALVTLKD